MAKPSSNSALYRLIEAGQLAHQTLLLPLRERGLEPGDDAILFELGRAGATPEQLAQLLRVTEAAVHARLVRLVEHDLVERRAVGPELAAGFALTDRGLRIRDALAEHWAQLEEALLGELKPKQRKRLTGALQRFVELLKL